MNYTTHQRNPRPTSMERDKKIGADCSSAATKEKVLRPRTARTLELIPPRQRGLLTNRGRSQSTFGCSSRPRERELRSGAAAAAAGVGPRDRQRGLVTAGGGGARVRAWTGSVSQLSLLILPPALSRPCLVVKIWSAQISVPAL